MPFSLRIAPGANPAQFTVWLNGQAGLSYTLLSSTDLVRWSGYATNTLGSNTFPFPVVRTNPVAQVFRGRWTP